MALTNVAAITADLQTYFAAELLAVAEPNMVFKQFGRVEQLPAHSSVTMSFTQYAKLTAVSSALTEGTAPTATALSNSAITAVVSQYGAFVQLTDLAELTPKHPVVQEALYLLGRQAGESIDSIIQTVLVAGTNIQYANGRTARANLLATDVMTTAEIRNGVRTMRVNSAVPFGSVNVGDGSENGQGEYVLVVDPYVEADITNDSTFVTAAEYSAVTKLFNNEVGKWFGCRVVRSNNIPTISSTHVVHTSYMIAKNAYATVDLQNLATYIEGPGSISDPLHQNRTLGWKVSFKSVILNQNWLLRIESGATGTT